MGALIGRLLAALIAFTAAMSPAAAHADQRLDADAAIAKSEAATGQVVGAHVLVDSRGEALDIASLRGRPLVISLVYTSCASVCPATTQHLLQAVREARRILGPNAFTVLTLGFDAAHDTPSRLAAFAGAQGINIDGWQLASGEAKTIAAVLDDLGFSFEAAVGGFAHLTQTTILDADGRVYRQVYGDNFPDQVFIEPLKELVFGTTTRALSISGLVDRIRFICTVYNPSTGAYEFDYGIAFGIAIGGLSLLLTGVVVFRLWRQNRRLVAARMAERRG